MVAALLGAAEAEGRPAPAAPDAAEETAMLDAADTALDAAERALEITADAL